MPESIADYTGIALSGIALSVKRADSEQNEAMLYMVIERYRRGPRPVYARSAARGRMLPEGLAYVNSWVVGDGDMDRCFQLMETSDPALFDVWLERWSDLVSVEIFPVITPAEAATRAGADTGQTI
jgi:hypothetical protein